MSLVDTETGEVVSALTPDDARTLTASIKTAVSVAWDLVVEAYRGRADKALGYESWDAYCDTEFDGARIRLPREERKEVVASLRESGMSIRAIAAATGSGLATVKRDLDAGVPSGTPAGDESTMVDAAVSATSAAIAAGLAARRAAGARQTAAERTKVTGLDGRDHAAARPKPVRSDEQVRAEEEAESDRRAARQLQAVVERWAYVQTLRTNPRRDLILAALTDHSRQRVLEIEKEIHGD